MRRSAILAPLALVTVAVAAGCGGGEVVRATPETVEGKVAAPPKGNPTRGRAVFASQQCANCHTFTPAGAQAEVGPNLDQLEEFARRANRGSLIEFTRASIVSPNEDVERGFPPTMPAYDYLSATQVNDLVAFLTQPGT